MSPKPVMPTIIDNITSGTTIILSELRKISPKKVNLTANVGTTPPMMVPTIMATTIPIKMPGPSPWFCSDPF